MVKVFKCHNFKSQSVVQVDGEPIAFFNHKEKLFVATDKCTIEVFSLGSSISKISSFSTTEQTIHDIVFCYPGNYVATIESTYNRRSKKNVFYIKVYLNWEVASGKGNHRTAIRLAGKDQNVTTSAVDESLIQVIEIPYEEEIQDFSICQKTGNLITVSKEITDVYHLVEKKILNSDRVYLDIVKFLQLEWHIGHVTKTVLCEDYIGVLSKRETQIVKVVYSDENLGRLQNVETDRRSSSERGNHQLKSSSVMSNVSFLSSKSSLSLPDTPQFSRVGCRSSANASPSLLLNKSVDSVSIIKEDDHFVKINLDDLKLNQSHSSNKSIKTIHLKKLQEHNCDKVLEPDVTDFRGGGHQTAGSIHVMTVHHQKTKRTEDEFRHLQLIPSYISNISRLSTRVMLGSVPLRSVVYNSMVGISCFVSSDSNGYVFDIWSSVSTQLSTYSYSDIPMQIVMNEDLLYVLTGRGLEIYTSCCGTAAIHHTERFNTKEKVL
ncbi:HPS3 [Mytilus edulis]|uniref:HPS3 n=1 Tax=Mytilus edulis TaxID=6550 RepID=A0A8S3QAJ0_MYTED|nr:HPS3 [Mytilus edulis]